MSDFNSYPEQELPEFMQIFNSYSEQNPEFMQHLPEQAYDDGFDPESMIIHRTKGDGSADIGHDTYGDELITRGAYGPGDEERFAEETHQRISDFWRRQLDALAEKARNDIETAETTAAEGEVLPASEVYQVLRFVEGATPVERPAFPRTIDSEVIGEDKEAPGNDVAETAAAGSGPGSSSEESAPPESGSGSHTDPTILAPGETVTIEDDGFTMTTTAGPEGGTVYRNFSGIIESGPDGRRHVIQEREPERPQWPEQD